MHDWFFNRGWFGTGQRNFYKVVSYDEGDGELEVGEDTIVGLNDEEVYPCVRVAP